MSPTKETITLTEAQETLLIPLYSKAMESEGPNPILHDAMAQEILGQVDYDFTRLKTPRKTTITLAFRANRLDHYAGEFIRQHPENVILHLGCGLDSRCQRVPNPRGQWYDLDMPDVIALRRKFYPETERYHLLASSVTDLGWMDSVSAQGRPVLVIAEGLLMYLQGADVKALLLRLQERFPGCELAFDAFSLFTVQRIQAHPSLRKTGAIIHWGLDDPKEIETWASGIRLKEEWFFSQAEEISRLGLGYRLAFKLASLFPVANKAQRILYYCL